jgi:hypothetical protein
MAQDFLKPTRVPTGDLKNRKMEDGMFRNPPTYSELGGFTSADKGKFQNNKMTLERGGPTAQKGRPI